MIDLRSDTVTRPTEAMREAAANAVVGDDVFGDDPTVIELETYAANLVGKEAALFVTSGTQGNLTSVLTQTTTGDEVLLEERSHIMNSEVGGISAIAHCIPRPYQSNNGFIEPEMLETYLHGENVHYAHQTLFCIENTHNYHGGIALSVDQVRWMAETAHQHGLKVHLDGARIFNACTFHNEDVKSYTKHVDSIQFCLSKGLGAPIGSMIAGSKEFIDKARRKRKMLGGGLRQVGMIAAPALIALRDERDRLVQDHINARTLETGIRELGLDVLPSQTNIVIVHTPSNFNDSNEAVEALAKYDVLTVPFGSDRVRLTTHKDVNADDIKIALEKIEKAWIKA